MKNIKKSICWLGKAAKQNVKQAYYNLAELYLKGHGVKSDTVKAVQYYEEAAKLNYVDAQRKLGFLYFQGREIKQNLVQSYLYLSLAADHNDISSINMLSVVSKQMTPQQLKQANDLVKNYKFASKN
tara:strand:+ start:8624 stop:9004 length:381 start_codon:yes stop_codon:yes gene_type:complete